MMERSPIIKDHSLSAVFFIVFFFAAFLLNVTWEVCHSMLYDWDPPMHEYIPVIVWMAAKDALWVLIFYFAAAAALLDLFWVEKKNRTGFYIMALCGFMFSVGIELHAQATGRWYYNELMPVIPLLGIGLTPIMQMTLLPSFAAWDAWGVFRSLVKNNFS
jgi:hypothetical protein